MTFFPLTTKTVPANNTLGQLVTLEFSHPEKVSEWFVVKVFRGQQ